MSLSELRSGAYDEKNRLDIKDLPNEVVAKITSFVYRKDGRGKLAYFAEFETTKGRKFTQKYTNYYWDELGNACEELNLDGLFGLQGKYFNYTMKTFLMGNPRYIPVAIATE